MKKQSINTADVFAVMEKWAPKHYAYDWDNVGLQVGSYKKTVKKIMTTLDVVESVVDEAIANQVDLIIAHHPLLFQSLKQVDIASPKGKIIQKLLKHDISVYAAHTNLDVTNGGVNDMLCDALHIHAREVLVNKQTEKYFKIIVYVPETHANELRDGLAASGAGHIGNYSHCTFQTSGQGTFKPLKGTNPYIGSIDELEVVDELRMETIVRAGEVNQTIHALMNHHPYEEPAYDIFPMANEGPAYGLGRVGVLTHSMNLHEFTEHVKTSLDIPHVRVTGDETKEVNRVAVLGGSGENYFKAAVDQHADVYLTGDVTFHTAQDARDVGLSIIDPGHYAEKVMKQGVQKYLVDHLEAKDVEIITSSIGTDPFTFQ